MMQVNTVEQVDTVKRVSNRVVELEFLYLDLNTCTRCVGTNENLETAMQTVADVLAFTKTELAVNKILIENEEQARKHQFVTSPTIRVNGRDIALEFRESRCDSCTDLCGCAEGTNCREWVYEGEVTTEAPVGMIVEAILSEIFRDAPAVVTPTDAAPTDTVPDNLKSFFAAKASPETAVSATCCSETEQQTCCEPAAKADCCGTTSASGGCGCQ